MKIAVWTIGVIAAFTLAIIAPSDFKKNDLEFEPSAWRSADARIRGQMTSSLLGQAARLSGKTSSEIKSLLGDPTVEGKDFVSYQIKHGFLIEAVMPSRVYLIIEFVDDRVSRVTVADA